MIVEKSFDRAKLTGQAGGNVGNSTLEITPHPVTRDCCILTVLDSKNAIIAAITVNNSELKRVADMLCGIDVD